MVGTLLVIFGAMGIAGAIFGKDFYAADGLGLHEFKPKQNIPIWLGRLVFGLAGVGLIAVGIKMLMRGE
jgi:hypothetical protein